MSNRKGAVPVEEHEAQGMCELCPSAHTLARICFAGFEIFVCSFVWFDLVWFFETGFLCVALEPVLELGLQTRLIECFLSIHKSQLTPALSD